MNTLRLVGRTMPSPQWEGHDGHPFHVENEGGYLLYFEEYISCVFCISIVHMQYVYQSNRKEPYESLCFGIILKC